MAKTDHLRYRPVMVHALDSLRGFAMLLGVVLHAAVSFLPFEAFTLKDAALFLSMLFIGLACILLGSGIPTTALYIMLATVAQPALAQLGDRKSTRLNSSH